ncbi:Alpha/beta-hydrolase [Mycena sanguinolenta]|uniref:Alpha/beta-hydrolase n=1 Tax=Mycena sanguinolenta TaxID=230812 RepID=A0A8H6ZFJ6_9AGAR|nr:Alpha/beta-hydrolase [Mycena sanguinolenta]
MRFFVFSTFLLCIASGALAKPLQKRDGVSRDVFDDLLLYYKYASSTYTDCASPNGNVMVQEINEDSTNTQGFVARDDTKKEIVVAWRGSSAVADFLITDASVIRVDYTSPGVTPASGATVHSGFLRSYNSVADQVIALVKTQLDLNPDYAVVSTGHSLGGSLASLSAVSLKSNFPDTPMRLYTYGQPRTGNQEYANMVNSMYGDQAFRYVRTTDGVPTAFPMLLGYRHHGVEYWQTSDPAIAATLKQCAPDGEDPTCSDSKLSDGFTATHLTYFGIYFNTPFCT